jgi:hypothetical protein
MDRLLVVDSTDFLLLSARGILEIDPLLFVSVIRLRRHDEVSEVVTLMGTELGKWKGLGVHNRADRLEWMEMGNENG